MLDPWNIAQLLGEKNAPLDPIWVKSNFIVITNLWMFELEIINVRSLFCQIFKSRVDGKCILILVGDGFVGTIDLLQNIYAMVYVLDIVWNWPG